MLHEVEWLSRGDGHVIVVANDGEQREDDARRERAARRARTTWSIIPDALSARDARHRDRRSLEITTTCRRGDLRGNEGRGQDSPDLFPSLKILLACDR